MFYANVADGDALPCHGRLYGFESRRSLFVYTGKIPLQVHHTDGNYLNHDEKNLELLCPNCHSLTSTNGTLNKGNGRRKRRIHRAKFNTKLKLISAGVA